MSPTDFIFDNFSLFFWPIAGRVILWGLVGMILAVGIYFVTVLRFSPPRSASSRKKWALAIGLLFWSWWLGAGVLAGVAVGAESLVQKEWTKRSPKLSKPLAEILLLPVQISHYESQNTSGTTVDLARRAYRRRPLEPVFWKASRENALKRLDRSKLNRILELAQMENVIEFSLREDWQKEAFELALNRLLTNDRAVYKTILERGANNVPSENYATLCRHLSQAFVDEVAIPLISERLHNYWWWLIILSLAAGAALSTVGHFLPPEEKSRRS